MKLNKLLLVTGLVSGVQMYATDATADAPANCTALNIDRVISEAPVDRDYTASNVIDGDLDEESRWSSKGDNQSIILDLGEQRDVDLLRTAWFRGDQRTAFFRVDTGANLSNLQTVLANGMATGSTDFINIELEAATVARFVRITGFGNSMSQWNSIKEVEVLECDNNPEPPPPPPPRPTADNPSDVIPFFDKWRITIGDGSSVDNLIDYSNEDYFFTANDGEDWVVYKSPNAGETTPNSPNTRSELRQFQEWTPEEGGVMTGTLKVMGVSTSADARFAPSFSVVVGQIHSSEGHENEPLKIFYKKFPGHDKGSVSWNYEINTAGSNDGRWDFNTAVWGYDWTVVGVNSTDYPPEPEDGIELGEEFSYTVDVSDGIMILTFEAEGHPTRTFTKSLIESEYTTRADFPAQVERTFVPIGQDGVERPEAYAGELQYFKQGTYNQTNGKAPEDVGTEGTTFWNTAGDTYGGDLDEQYANGAFAEVWFKTGTVSANVRPQGLLNGGFETGLSSWRQVEPAFESGDTFDGVVSAKLEAGGSISQKVLVVPGEDYTLSAALSRQGDDMAATVEVGGSTISVPLPGEEGSYERTSVEFNAGNNDEITITFFGGFLLVDDVVLDGPIPE